jgi:hypothetical protein
MDDAGNTGPTLDFATIQANIAYLNVYDDPTSRPQHSVSRQEATF